MKRFPLNVLIVGVLFGALAVVVYAAGALPTWDAVPTPAVSVVIGSEPTLATPPTADEKEQFAKLQAKPGLTWKQRRAMGITIRNVMGKMREMQRNGELEGKGHSTIAADVMQELIEENPKAFADPSLDFDVILEFIKRLIPIVLMLFTLF